MGTDMIVVVMGVAGCGKTSVGERLAERLGWAMLEGDAFHPQANKDKMAGGTPLTDDDRLPWLDEIAREMRRHDSGGQSAIVTCSALKRSYRDRPLRSCSMCVTQREPSTSDSFPSTASGSPVWSTFSPAMSRFTPWR